MECVERKHLDEHCSRDLKCRPAWYELMYLCTVINAVYEVLHMYILSENSLLGKMLFFILKTWKMLCVVNKLSA